MLTLRGVVIDRPDWWQRAACTGGNTKPWFPGRGVAEEPAKRICDGCPVADQCLAYALADPRLHGIWGGTNETERDLIRARRRTA